MRKWSIVVSPLVSPWLAFLRQQKCKGTNYGGAISRQGLVDVLVTYLSAVAAVGTDLGHHAPDRSVVQRRLKRWLTKFNQP